MRICAGLVGPIIENMHATAARSRYLKGQMRADTSFDVMLRHLDHLIMHLGEDRVGLGSDFDGTTVPDAIGSAVVCLHYARLCAIMVMMRP